MKRHASWFQILAVALVLVGLVTLAAPAPAQAMDPRLALGLASAAGAIALLVGYLIVANSRDKERSASLEGVYACSDREESGPMGCGGPASSASAAFTAATEGPMAAYGRTVPRAEASPVLADGCPAGQVGGPMGCIAATGGESTRSAPAPAALSPAVVGQ